MALQYIDLREDPRIQSEIAQELGRSIGDAANAMRKQLVQSKLSSIMANDRASAEDRYNQMTNIWYASGEEVKEYMSDPRIKDYFIQRQIGITSGGLYAEEYENYQKDLYNRQMEEIKLKQSQANLELTGERVKEIRNKLESGNIENKDAQSVNQLVARLAGKMASGEQLTEDEQNVWEMASPSVLGTTNQFEKQMKDKYKWSQDYARINGERPSPEVMKSYERRAKAISNGELPDPVDEAVIIPQPKSKEKVKPSDMILMLDNIESLIKENSEMFGYGKKTVSEILSQFGNEKASKLLAMNAVLTDYVQSYARMRQSGKLSDQDVILNKAILPDISDSAETAYQKIQFLRKEYEKMQASREENQPMESHANNIYQQAVKGGWIKQKEFENTATTTNVNVPNEESFVNEKGEKVEWTGEIVELDNGEVGYVYSDGGVYENQ